MEHKYTRNEMKKKWSSDIELGCVDEIEKESKIISEKPYPNTLTESQMEALTAVCDTLLPCLDVSAHTSDDCLVKYYATSASMASTPQRLGGVISSRLVHPKKWLMKVALWALSTWYGTFILCGMASLSTAFPYFQRFAKVSELRREQILRSWSQSYFFLLRILYAALKLLTLFVFFTQVDEKNQNQAWKAIGYSGPDPELKAQTSKQEEKDDFGPLCKGIANLNDPTDHLLRTHGFPVRRSCESSGGSSSISRPFLTIQCDAVVVGSGSGGGVVAGVLASAGYKVVVLEKGSYFARNSLSLLEGPTMDRMYLSGGLLATHDMDVFLLAGSTVGGGSTINWSASIRTPEHVAAEWCRSCHLELFESKLYREALDRVCERMGVQSDVAEEGLNNAVLRRGCEELGYPVSTIPRNAPADHHCGWCCLGCRDGRKRGVSETWLVDLVESGNGVILPGCSAARVLHRRLPGRERNTATGVAFEAGGETCVVEAKVTVVACGALRTPPLLRASGLRNPAIGKNLHLHPVVMAWGHFPEEEARRSFEGGIMTAMSGVPAPDGSGYGAVIQTPALHPGMFSTLTPWLSGRDLKERMRRFPRTAHVFALARDRGSGAVESESCVRYRLAGSDEESLQRGLERALRILAAAGAEEIGTHHRGGRSINVRTAGCRQVERFVREESRRGVRGHAAPICSAHQMGTCRMGVDRRTSAVGPTGETWEVEGLYVADSSVFPTALGVNPMVTVQAIAYCTAHALLQVLSRKAASGPSDHSFL